MKIACDPENCSESRTVCNLEEIDQREKRRAGTEILKQLSKQYL
jgi:hypothetical protein